MKRLVILMLLLASSVCGATEFWSTNSQRVPIYFDLSLNLIEEFRLSDNPDVFVQYIGLSHPINKNWSVAGWYKYVLIDDLDYNSSRIILDANFKRGFISNRFRFENISEIDVWVYRDRITLSTSIGKIKPFISDEFFISLHQDYDYMENRLKGGIGFTINEKISMKVSYMLRDRKKRDNWVNSDAVCLSTMIKF